MSSEKDMDAILQNLKDAGCEEDMIQEFMRYEHCECRKMQLCVLAKQRKRLLENIHAEQKKIDCLDFLTYKLKKENHCSD